MMDVSQPFAASLVALASIVAVAVALWFVSVFRRDVSIVDSAWSLFHLIAAVIYFVRLPHHDGRATLVLIAVTVWALRLSVYITWRNHGHGEDSRYRAMRERNQPGFALKSLYLVFGLQAVLAWLLSMPVLAVMSGAATWSPFDVLGALLFALGFFFESVGDWQLARFKHRPANCDRVMDRGLWRYTRHPNYFGECCMAWGLYLFALAAGGWWTVFAPLLITFLLLKVSGVALLEKDIGERRPAYRDYIASTNAFVPGPPRRPR